MASLPAAKPSKKPYVKPSVQSERTISNPITVRLNTQTQEALTSYMNANNMTVSQAVRMVVAVALRDELSSDEAFQRQAFREGVTKGLAAIRERMSEAIESALEELE